MYRLDYIEVQGFRNQAKPIKLQLKPDANFLIGRNGTGKTTLINLIHAALSADIASLREGRFSQIEMQFTATGTRKKPRVKVVRHENDEGIAQITYVVRPTTSSKPQEFVFLRMRRRIVTTAEGERRPVRARSSIGPLREILGEIYSTSWLSLQRGENIFEQDEDGFEKSSGSDVDRKLESIMNELVRYFSRLDRQVAEQTQLFQKRWFLSFLATERAISPHAIKKINIDEERSALTSIFEKFNMTPESYESQLERHLKLAKKAAESINESGNGLLKDYLILFDVMRLHSLVEQWQYLQKAQLEIYKPKTEFEHICSDMLFRKKVQINRSNQIVVQSDTEESIPIKSLSSGEKQLLIFFSETLLQEQSPYIFLADEPELSLHIEWQEELVRNILRINPNAQVLFATHSPDIVSVYQDNIFKMEELID